MSYSRAMARTPLPSEPNRLLAALPARDRRRLLGDSDVIVLVSSEPRNRTGSLHRIYYSTSGSISLIVSIAGPASIEVDLHYPEATRIDSRRLSRRDYKSRLRVAGPSDALSTVVNRVHGVEKQWTKRAKRPQPTRSTIIRQAGPTLGGNTLQHASMYIASLLLAAVFIASSAGAKEGISATLLTPIPPTAVAGSQIALRWSLADKYSGKPLSACSVFIRLIGSNGDYTEAFAGCGRQAAEGQYNVTAVVPVGGISRIEIGVAGTRTDKDGNSERSDWLMPLTNNPVGGSGVESSHF